jgi:uncharacterized membrane protein YkvA (DUF1232 family)
MPVRALQRAIFYFRVFTRRDTPWYSKGLAVLAVLYLISPYDFIPDWILGPGFIDDIAVVALLLSYGVRLVNTKRTEKENQNRDGN